MGYDVRARDCANNIASKSVAFRPGVFQEDGDSFGYFGVTATYVGSWGVSNCQCFSGGMTKKSTAQYARANFAFNYDAARPVGLVMEKAPGRGKASILLDGRLMATIDTHANVPTHRIVVWAGNVPAGSHTLSVVNLATAGRPRIDVDAVMVSGLSA